MPTGLVYSRLAVRVHLVVRAAGHGAHAPRVRRVDETVFMTEGKCLLLRLKMSITYVDGPSDLIIVLSGISFGSEGCPLEEQLSCHQNGSQGVRGL